MTTTSELSIRPWRGVTTLLSALALTTDACRQGSAPAATTAESSRIAAAVGACAVDSLHPATAAPAAGLWVGERGVPTVRVAAMVGPASADADRARITRRIETLELRTGATPIRLVSDTVTLRLELLPRLGATDIEGMRGADAEPAGVYAISPLVMLASYEPCAASADEPRIRYLRRDGRGDVTTDLMLRRESAETRGTLR